jgi:hypothetical protein
LRGIFLLIWPALERCGSPLGRRRPFILIGTIFCGKAQSPIFLMQQSILKVQKSIFHDLFFLWLALGMALISYCVTLGELFGDNPLSNNASDHFRTITFAVFLFLLLSSSFKSNVISLSFLKVNSIEQIF